MGQPGDRWDRRCDCTRPKRFGAISCDACKALDGEGGLGKIISALRVLGGQATLYELVEETGLSLRQVHRLCKKAPGLRQRMVEVVEVAGKHRWGNVFTVWALHQVPA